ncbi:hypothetical protein OSB04_003931 [Centaurea solstitialis]|uniref:Cytochrome P450 n=1 Tax=Centaurea solstitialis TaxID=347529 RepID=A0AA38WU14_9ASTR|nr:hypothetical protein OSB04_003931 [Centaurea solstitialis]
MDFNLPFPTTLAVFIIFSITILTSLLQIFNRSRANSRKYTRNPPQAKGAWPIIGHLHLLRRSHLPHKILGAMADSYGPIFTIKLGVRQALVISDADTARVCFTANDLDFADRPTTVVSELLGYSSAKFSFAPYGDYWRKIRKIVTLELLSQRRVEMLGDIRVSEVRSATNEIYEACVTNNDGFSDLAKVEMKQWFGKLILNVVLRSVSGKRFSADDDEGVRFQAVARRYFKLMGAFLVSDFVPFLKGLDVGGYEKAMKETAREMDEFFEGWLREKLVGDDGRRKDEGSKVFMDVLISVLEDASEEDFNGFDHDTIIKASSLVLLTAGSETTTVTLIWALSLLLNNPKSLKVAQAELDEHVGRDRLVQESDLNNLSYLQAIIKETLRLYPPGPLSVPHQSRNDCVVAGYNIPKGTRLFVNLWKLHRDPNIWWDPDQFLPERFLTSKKDIDVKGNHFELLPFGSGRRMCPGVSFALQSLHFIMASLLQQFMLKTPSDEPIDMSESFGITNMKATPLELSMEFNLPFPTTLALIMFSITLLASLLQIFNRNRANNRNPPQAKGAWPIIGHLHLLGGSHLPHKVLGAMADTYGPIFTIKLSFRLALVVSDADMAKVCFTTNDLDFANRPTTVVSELLGYNSANFSFAHYGDYWRKLRRIVTLELLSQRRVEMLGDIRVSEVRSAIYKACNDSDMAKVEMEQWFGKLILNVVVRSVSGKRFSADDDEGVRFQAVARRYFKLLGAFLVSDFIPFLKGLDVGGYEKAMKETAREMDEFFEEWLRERVCDGRKDEGNPQVFMDVLISILKDASEKDFHGFNHDTIIKASSLALLTAGSETTTVTLIWALSLLLNNPKSLRIAQDELDEHVGRERLVEESNLNNLSYLQAIIKETLRLYPPGPLSVPHQSRNDCVVAGYNIPKGTRLFVNLWKLQRDPNIWSDPDQFQPERFLTSKKDIDVKGNHFELLPFGSGRRMCPGVSFALQSLHFIMASLLQQFVLKTPSDESVDMSESFGMTNMKATPLEVLLTPRLSPRMYLFDA